MAASVPEVYLVVEDKEGAPLAVGPFRGQDAAQDWEDAHPEVYATSMLVRVSPTAYLRSIR